MRAIRKLVFRGGGHCIAFPEPLLKFAGLEPGGVATVEAASDGTLRVRRTTPDDFVGQVNVAANLLTRDKVVGR